MLYKVVTMYGNLQDPDKFYNFYSNTLVPKILSLDGVVKIHVNRLSHTSIGDDEKDPSRPIYQVMGELYLTDVEKFLESLEKEEAGKFITQFLIEESRDYARLFLAFEETFENENLK